MLTARRICLISQQRNRANTISNPYLL